jgi:hypothetical protein
MTDVSAENKRLTTESDLHFKAIQAGLQRSLSLFPDDVAAAAATAAQAVSVLRKLDPPHPDDEPWPPMRAEAAP